MNTTKSCVTCGKLFQRKKFSKSFESLKRWNERTHCSRECRYADPVEIIRLRQIGLVGAAANGDRQKKVDDSSKFCYSCGKLLVRKRFQSKFESYPVYSRRKYCDMTCYHNDPESAVNLRKIEQRPEILAQLEVCRVNPQRIAPTEKRKQAAQVLRVQLLSGERRNPNYIKRSRDESIIYNGLTDDEIFAIQLDRRTFAEIAKAFSVGASTISRLKHKYDSYLPSKKGPLGKKVNTPVGIFDSISSAAKHFDVANPTVVRWIKGKKDGWGFVV